MEQGREVCYSCEESFMTDDKMMMSVGHGHFSEMKLAFHVPTVTCVAVKVLRMKKKNASLVEVSIMKSLQHPDIIKLFGMVQSRDTTYLMMEHTSQGDLRHILELGSLQESEARRLFTQILLAMQYCHANHIAHRDIKANNILLNCRGNAKLSGFDLAAKVTPGQKLRDFCSTLLYCAPELLLEKAYDGCAADIWSLGVLLFLMVVGHFPFQDSSSEGVRRQILAANVRIPEHVSRDIFNVIVKMLMIKPHRRPTVDQILMCPMIREGKPHSPPVSTQKHPGTVSRGIVSTMTVMGYKSEEIIDSLRDQKYDQVMATYPILQHQSPGGDCGLEATNNKEVSVTKEVTITKEAAIIQDPTITQEEDMAHEVTMTLEKTTTKEMTMDDGVSMTQTESITEEETIIKHEDIILEATITMEETVAQLRTLTQERTITQEEAITHGQPEDALTRERTITQEDTITKHEDIILEATITMEETVAHLRTLTRERTITQEEAITHGQPEDALTRERTITEEETITHGQPEDALTQERTITQEEAITHGQPEDAGPASSGNRRRSGWKRVKKIMVNCLRHLCCCCLPPAKRRQDSCKTLAPKTRDPAVTHRSSSEEVQPQLRGL
ncbi:sperm motility kinase 2B-like [Cricetulus griseus]|uniref:non-specific serine/threonine protein kinase n=1 Tax=Cricetulus griseus TaxID=10029 RepID=A0A9J7H7W6_CRIGR|nr:sperm motility kinase 2B-like [Cricetulus griseus]XP_035304881.1 sperm motility kinase 2B-like [Cricetulus griseus]